MIERRTIQIGLILIFCCLLTSVKGQFHFLTADGKLHPKAFYDSVRRSGMIITTKTVFDNRDSMVLSMRFRTEQQVVANFQNGGKDCSDRRRTKLSDILKITPYDSVHEIAVISFEVPHERDDRSPSIIGDNGYVDFSLVKETKVLSSKLKNQMIDLLYNFRNSAGRGEVYMCYNPRHAILLYDKHQKIIGVVEVCFECHSFRLGPPNLPVGDFCEEKFTLVKWLMREAGVTGGLE